MIVAKYRNSKFLSILLSAFRICIRPGNGTGLVRPIGLVLVSQHVGLGLKRRRVIAAVAFSTR